MDETVSDFRAHTLAPPVGVGIGAVGLAAGPAVQFTPPATARASTGSRW
jgi:hypothetical protein